ncbi:MAG: hypothetical protein H6742_09735 [Alphaproteobacteria bacterium]|nr:hypothetical protein [Alphaproteobacteria bacterium]
MGLLFLLLAGCADCTPLSQVEVYDPDDLATPEEEARVQQAIDDFAAMSGRETACVPQLMVVPDAWQSWAGLYNGPGDPIYIRASYLTQSIVWHELAHAVDEAEGLVARAHPRVFREEWIRNHDDYGSKGLRRDEVFARIAERGPLPVAQRERLWQECGADVDDRWFATRFVQDWLWTEATEPWWDDDPVAIDIGEEVVATELPTPLTAQLSSWWAIGDHTIRIARPRADPDPLRIVVADRWTGRTQWAAPFDPGDLDFDTLYARYLPRPAQGLQDGRPVVWLYVPGVRMQTWRVDIDGGTVTVEDPLLPWWLGDEHILGVVDDTVLVVEGGVLDAYDRRSHERIPLVRDEPDDEPVATTGWHLHDRGVDGFTSDGARFSIDLPTGTLSRGEPLAPLLDVSSPVWAGEDRWIAWAYDWRDDDLIPYVTLVAWDPATGSWHPPDDLCEATFPLEGRPNLQSGATGAWLGQWLRDEDDLVRQHAWPLSAR